MCGTSGGGNKMCLIVLAGQEEVLGSFLGGGATGMILPASKFMVLQITAIGGVASHVFHFGEEMVHRR